MTVNEFKAWLDGFSYGIGANPTPEQWSLIKEKLNTIVALPTLNNNYIIQNRPVFTPDMPLKPIAG